ARERSTGSQLVLDQGTCNRCLGLDITVVAVAQFKIRLRCEFRQSRSDIKGSSSRIFPKQSSLRSPQYFYLLDIDKDQRCGGRTRSIHPIQVEAYARIYTIIGQAVGGAQTTDIQ